MAAEHLLICGASARAAAFSALRAGLVPWSADLFRDQDLAARCPGLRLPAARYPDAFLEAAGQAPPGPWMYTGALENRPDLVAKLARRRPLWGNGRPVLGRARLPEFVAALLAAEGIPCPAICTRPGAALPQGVWLIKPRRGAGGSGIRFWTGEPPPALRAKPVYLQEYIAGEMRAALYIGDGEQARLLGVTRQLVGEAWLHARPFHYCGSMGPVELAPELRAACKRLGRALARGCRLRGLFGVDCVMRDDVPWPVEVNPRYTASVEVLEYATGVHALALHRKVFEAAGPEPVAFPGSRMVPAVGKAILFAREELLFPDDGPWRSALDTERSLHELPAFADIPHAGQRIAAGRPILSLFARAASPAGCQDLLRQIAADLDRWLFGR